MAKSSDMKFRLLVVFVLLSTMAFAQVPKSENVILVTFDGYRWQEMFGGAQKKIYKDNKYGKELKKLDFEYKGKTAQERRENLMPFFWGTIASQGAIYGNKKIGNRVTVTNGYTFSFPGYNEIFSGWGDKRINSNSFGDNPNTTIFDFLKTQAGFADHMVAIATWDAFPKIINVHRNDIPVIVNQTPGPKGECNAKDFYVQKYEISMPLHGAWAKTDTFTYKMAKEYMYLRHPKFMFIGFDETDDYAHDGNYAAYLSTAHMLDNYMKDLWNFIQNDPTYANKTTLIITCDHGRGDIPKLEWRHHGHVLGAENIWIAAIGPNVAVKGEVKEKQHFHQDQIAATVAQLLGLTYTSDHQIGAPIEGFVKK